MEKEPHKTRLNSLSISTNRLLQFTRLFEAKTGVKLSGEDTLMRAETLLRTMSLLYHPICEKDFNTALIRKLFLRRKKLSAN